MRFASVVVFLTISVVGKTSAQTVTDFYPQSGGIGSSVVIHVDNPRIHDMKEPDIPDKLRLFINGRVIPDIVPLVDKVNNRLTFDLAYGDKPEPAWQHALGFGKSVSLSVGFPDKGPFPVSAAPLTDNVKPRQFLMEVSGSRFAVFAVLFAGLVIGFLILATGSNLLRNAELAGTTPGAKPYAYSLARSQMAWWTFLTMGAAIFIWLLTDRLIMTKEVLILLGISFATGLSAIMVDAGKQAGAAAAANKAVGETAQVEAAAAVAASNARAAAAMNMPPPNLAAIEKSALDIQNLAAAQAEKASVLAAESRPPKGKNNFLRDILSDENGISFHRFQIVAWTLVLGFYFIFEVSSKFAMPVFSEELLVLMGISNSTYLGFKFPERRS